MSVKTVLSAVESDEWDEFEKAPVETLQAPCGVRWAEARERVRAAEAILEDVEKDVRKMFPESMEPGSTKVIRLDGQVCAVLKTHSRMNWDSEILKGMIEDKMLSDALKLSVHRKEFDRLPESLQKALEPAMKRIPYERLTLASFDTEEEANKIMEQGNV
jgi:hypothetical protein